MTEFVIALLIVGIYMVVQSRGPSRSVTGALDRVGLRVGPARGYAWAVVLLVPLLAAAWAVLALMPSDIAEMPGVTVTRVTTVVAAIGVILRAVGEELLFRGLIAGVLQRRLGFAWGNLAQAAVFLLPHLLLLAVDVRLWPILPIQFAAGWLLGALRSHARSFLPGAVVHAVANLVAGLLVA